MRYRGTVHRTNVFNVQVWIYDYSGRITNSLFSDLTLSKNDFYANVRNLDKFLYDLMFGAILGLVKPLEFGGLSIGDLMMGTRNTNAAYS